MKYFFFFVILGLCTGGYYEYNILQHQSAADQQQISDLSGKVVTLQSDNKQLEDDKTQLKKNADDAQAKIADLTKQLQETQSALADAKTQPPPTPKATTSPAATAAAPRPTNNLGTIVTLGGKTFQNCQLLKVDADGIVVNYPDGITKILYGLLPPELQKRFGYDPHQAAALTEAQIQYQEEQRKAAAQAAGK